MTTILHILKMAWIPQFSPTWPSPIAGLDLLEYTWNISKFLLSHIITAADFRGLQILTVVF